MIHTSVVSKQNYRVLRITYIIIFFHKLIYSEIIKNSLSEILRNSYNCKSVKQVKCMLTKWLFLTQLHKNRISLLFGGKNFYNNSSQIWNEEKRTSVGAQ